MNANDWQDAESARALAISELAEVCAAMGLSWTSVDKKFIIDLPDVVLTSALPKLEKQRKTFDISTWGDTGIDETAIPDDFQMPDNGEILEEGVPPQGDKDAEK